MPMTAQAADGPAYEDLTGRARIRDAALRLFAECGVDGTTTRDIARSAGVSAGLIRHHFGSKEGLREVCDAYALDWLIRRKEAVAESGFDLLTRMGDPAALLMQRYLGRALADRSEAATAMFTQLVDMTLEWLTRERPDQCADLRAYAAVLVTMQLGLLIMHDPLHQVLGDGAVPAQLRIIRATVDMHARTLLDADLADQARAALELHGIPTEGAQ
jgi:AcrR family transcriptional regulator